MDGPDCGTDWGGMLDRLSACITPPEDAAVRRLGRDTTIPAPLLEVRMHNLVAGLLVKHGLTTWPQLHTSFPGYGTPIAEEGSGGRGLLNSVDGQQESKAQGEDMRQARKFGREGIADDNLDSAGCRGKVHRGLIDGFGRKRHPDEQPGEAKTHPKRRKVQVADTSGGMAAAGESTLADYPRIVSWWHPTKNGERLPADYTHGSGKRVWLQCPGCLNCGEVHEWDVRTANLTRSGGDIRCPFCVPTAGLFCSCRAISANERLAAQWHEDNPSPATIHQGSTKKFKWRCLDAACGHIWEAKPEDRTRAGGTNCPKCAMKRFSKGVKHPCVAVGRPELLAEWDEEKNTLLPTEVSCGSDKKVWWLCKVCEWSWQARVCNRAQRKTGCPKCRSSS